MVLFSEWEMRFVYVGLLSAISEDKRQHFAFKQFQYFRDLDEK